MPVQRKKRRGKVLDVQPFSDADLLWLAERIHDHRTHMADHARWGDRVHQTEIDNLIWSSSVDGVESGGAHRIVKDAWIPSGRGLRDIHFQRAPYTDKARLALDTNDLKSIKREHIVPRLVIFQIVLQTATPADTKRVLAEYSRVALVHESECTELKPNDWMPPGWDADVDWKRLPPALPDRWQRYRNAKPAIVPRYYDGRRAF